MGKISYFDFFVSFLSVPATPESEKEKTGKNPRPKKKRGKKLLVISIIVLVLLVAGGIGGYRLFFSDKPSNSPSYTPRFPDDFNWVDILPGIFIMGYSNGTFNQGPSHLITISKDFQMLKFEVTQTQWKAVMGKWEFESDRYIAGIGDNHPVYYVSWNDCQSFISKLNKLDSNYTYRLPTEAEWEYCCRAGSNTNYSFGDDEERLGDYAWYQDNSYEKTHPVGQKLPNAWGLYDMHGNVRELCQDWYDENYYEHSPDTDPQGPSSGTQRAFRCGDWDHPAWASRSSRRNGISPDFQNDSRLGFRLVREEA